MSEKIVGPYQLIEAENYMVELMDKSGAFQGGGKPVVGRLEKSYGNGKIIGVCSLDNKVYTRIDYDNEKGFHFNFTNDLTNEKYVIKIEGITEEVYRKYIDRLTKGKDTTLKNSKRNIIVYDSITGERVPVIWDEKNQIYERIRPYAKYATEKIKEATINDMLYEKQNDEKSQEYKNKIHS